MVKSPTMKFMSGAEDGKIVQPSASGPELEIVFGRMASCAVVLQYDPSVSRRHSRLFWRNDSWWLCDLGSTNGTFLNEFSARMKVVDPVPILFGQIFQVGKTKFLFEPAMTKSVTNIIGASAQA